jgi:hypothetical protein
MRYAIYWCPREGDPLLDAGEVWLGRRVGGEHVAQAPLDGLSLECFAALTRNARRYGFHATLAPPIALVDGKEESDFIDAANTLARRLVPVAMPRFAVATLADFVALRPVEDDAVLRETAARAVSAVDPLRRAATAAQLVRRHAHPLTAREGVLLARWGYPYVFDAYRFHVTLSDRVADPATDLLKVAAQRHFSSALAWPRVLDGLALFVEPGQDAPFRLLTRIPFGGS